MKNIFCPISTERINEQVPRVTSLLVVVLVIIGFSLQSLLVFAFLAADFAIRAFTKMRFSALSCVAYWITLALKLPAKQIDKAPKIFAARMGFLMVAILSVLFASDMQTASKIVAGILVVFASLEFAIAFCAGCTIYTFLVLPFFKK
ncbi:DUF4395 domain-containing protein [Mangrovibacterium diazotrophicum]|uniref:Uncharacterized protein DUF4395 n=1 Tax=Mangrovibacterium diazotrophicum TaxID=1261403 RepID=A0A419W8U5_9BACT|nr:DUF4395 domain-containing protein [Mangrovibacterium diazotrophicum]RKD91898.1 uncharacterized protein DUF4395 [Mangrovibacterium diazotrophicum]